MRKSHRAVYLAGIIGVLGEGAFGGTIIFNPPPTRPAPPAHISTSYSISDLGAFGGGTSGGVALNDSGEVTGYCSVNNGSAQGFVYSNGTMTALNLVANATASTPSGINSSGQIVGTVYVNNVAHAFVYSNGVMTDLSRLFPPPKLTLPPTIVYSHATGIDDAGHVIGYSGTDQYGNVSRGFYYAGGTVTDIGSLGGPWGAKATAINGAGVITGSSDVTNLGVSHSFTYSRGGSMLDIGTLSLPPGVSAESSVGKAINASGEIAGDSGFQAFLYANGTMTDLGALPDYSNWTDAQGINDGGDVVGESSDNGFSTAFLYSHGILYDLNALVDPSSGWILEGAADINNVGQITGFGSNAQGETHAFLLTPMAAPEPGSLGVLAVGVGLFLRRHSSRAE